MKKFKVMLGFALVALFLVACGGGAAVEDTVEDASEAVEEVVDDVEEVVEDAVEEAEEVIESIGSADDLAEVAREDTLIMGWSHATPIGTTNPWAVPGYTHQDAGAFMWEGLAYFRIFADEPAPWLAESMEYNDDFTQLTIKLRPEAKWSDGVSVTSADVVYTLEGQLSNNTLAYHAAFDQFVESIEAVDDLTTVVNFNQPAPSLCI